MNNIFAIVNKLYTLNFSKREKTNLRFQLEPFILDEDNQENAS